MTLDIRSFAIGIATVLGILVVGFGGGVMMGGVISGGEKTPNKIERQASGDVASTGNVAAKDVKEGTPAIGPAAVAQPAQAIPASEPAARAQSAPQPASPSVAAHPATPAREAQYVAPPAPAPSVTAQTPTPALGSQRPVSLSAPVADPSHSLSRREQARLRVQQRREERARRREERHRRWAERRQHDEIRREQMHAAAGTNRQEADQDADNEDRLDAQRVFRPRGLFDGLFRPFN